jgi:hypothetical protein
MIFVKLPGTIFSYYILSLLFLSSTIFFDRLCGLVVRVLSTDPKARVRFPALPEKKVVGLERGLLSLVSVTEELLDRKVAAPV